MASVIKEEQSNGSKEPIQYDLALEVDHTGTLDQLSTSPFGFLLTPTKLLVSSQMAPIIEQHSLMTALEFLLFVRGHYSTIVATLGCQKVFGKEAAEMIEHMFDLPAYENKNTSFAYPPL